MLADAVHDIEICNESVEAIVRLMRLQKRQGGYNQLPPISVHSLASAASIVLLKLYMEGPANQRPDTAEQLKDILSTIDGVAETWSSALQVREMVNQAVKTITGVHESKSCIDWDYETAMADYDGMFWLGDEANELGDFDLGQDFFTTFD